MSPRADLCSRRGRHGLSFRVHGRCQCRPCKFHGNASLSTKQRILETALELFNAEGVAALSAVDIATALGISPGHLYYHFKGKPEILVQLAEAYQGEVELVLEAALGACRGRGATLETLWTHVHILAEEAWDARFLYREAGALALRHPDLAARIRRITAAEREALRAMLTAMDAAGAIAASPEVIDGLSRLMTTGIGFHAIQLELEGDPGPPRARVARAAAQIMLLPAGLAPIG
jgi:AcrR family transcriptional regulator